MNSILMIYYSLEGNTELAAHAAEETGKVDTERLIPDKEPPRSGAGKFLVGGRSAIFGENVKLSPLTKDIAAYDTIIIGFPIWAGTYPPAIAAFIKEYPFKGKNLYVIACSSGGKTEKAVKKLGEKLPDNRLRGSLSLTDPLNDKEEAQKRVRQFINGIL